MGEVISFMEKSGRYEVGRRGIPEEEAEKIGTAMTAHAERAIGVNDGIEGGGDEVSGDDKAPIDGEINNKKNVQKEQEKSKIEREYGNILSRKLSKTLSMIIEDLSQAKTWAGNASEDSPRWGKLYMVMIKNSFEEMNDCAEGIGGAERRLEMMQKQLQSEINAGNLETVVGGLDAERKNAKNSPVS